MLNRQSILPKILLAAVIFTTAAARSESEAEFRSVSSIEESLAVEEIVVNHDGIRRSIDLNIMFEVDSAVLSDATLEQVDFLGQAMSGERLRNTRFVIIGHTDASGTDEYNLALSRRRASTVRDWIIAKYHVGADRLVVIGKGEEALKPDVPALDSRQRRVEVVAESLPSSGSEKAEQPSISSSTAREGVESSKTDLNRNIPIDWDRR